jgi:hypothetical protein
VRPARRNGLRVDNPQDFLAAAADPVSQPSIPVLTLHSADALSKIGDH